MSIRIGINGFGRMGKLSLRAGWGFEELEIIHINEIKGDAICHATCWNSIQHMGAGVTTSAPKMTSLFKAATDGPLAGILGYEERPLVSIDYKDDPRSSIVDALSTMVVDGTQIKVLAWYDIEWGYVNRMMELARKMALTL